MVLWNSGSDSDCLERNFKILGKIELGSEKLSGLACGDLWKNWFIISEPSYKTLSGD